MWVLPAPLLLARGWSSPVARQAHNLKVTGSNPVPATNVHASSDHRWCPARIGLCSLYVLLYHDLMSRRSGSADLPLHGGRVPKWLGERMTRLGAVIAEAVVLHFGRDELLRRLAHPFWFQSFGAVMGMDWHSSGITTSVIGALKRGLKPLEGELGIYVCGGPRHPFAQDSRRADRHRRAYRCRRRGARPRQPTRCQGRQRRRAGWVPALPPRLHRHRRWQVGRGPAGHEGRSQAGASLSLALGGADQLRRCAACGNRGRRAGDHRQPRRSPRRRVARRAADAARFARARHDRAPGGGSGMAPGSGTGLGTGSAAAAPPSHHAGAPRRARRGRGRPPPPRDARRCRRPRPCRFRGTPAHPGRWRAHGAGGWPWWRR